MPDFLTTTADRLQAKTTQLQQATADAMANAVASSTHDWLQAHPVALRSINLIFWAVDRPIISACLILIAIAIAISIIKAINRLLEIAGLSLLKAPFQLSQSLLKLSWQSGSAIVNRKNSSQLAERSSAMLVAVEQQRVKEISIRLNELQQEHNQLLQELIAICDSEQPTCNNERSL